MTGILFFLIIILLIASIIAIALYNKLIYLRTTRQNSIDLLLPKLNDQFTALETLSDKDSTLLMLCKQRKKTHKAEEQVHIENSLVTLMPSLLAQSKYRSAKDQQILKPILNSLESVQDEKRYFNHITKERNARLAIFPTNIIASLGGYIPGKIFLLDAKQQEGISPEPKFT